MQKKWIDWKEMNTKWDKFYSPKYYIKKRMKKKAYIFHPVEKVKNQSFKDTLKSKCIQKIAKLNFIYRKLKAIQKSQSMEN